MVSDTIALTAAEALKNYIQLTNPKYGGIFLMGGLNSKIYNVK